MYHTVPHRTAVLMYRLPAVPHLPFLYTRLLSHSPGLSCPAACRRGPARSHSLPCPLPHPKHARHQLLLCRLPAPLACLPACLPPCLPGACLQDGVLNDAELNAFQVLCFNAPLQAEELVGVKQVVAERIEQVGAAPVLACVRVGVKQVGGWVGSVPPGCPGCCWLLGLLVFLCLCLCVFVLRGRDRIQRVVGCEQAAPVCACVRGREGAGQVRDAPVLFT